MNASEAAHKGRLTIVRRAAVTDYETNLIPENARKACSIGLIQSRRILTSAASCLRASLSARLSSEASAWSAGDDTLAVLLLIKFSPSCKMVCKEIDWPARPV